MLISSETGISGKLFSSVGEIYSKIKSGSSKLFIGRMEVTFGILHRLLSGIRFHPTHESTLVFRSSIFKPGNSWVTGEHIEMLIQLMYKKPHGYFFPDQKSKPVLLSPSFYTYNFSGANEEDAVYYLRAFARINHLSVPDTNKLICDILLVPVNLDNNHWLLIVIWCQALAFTILNPVHPTQPTQKEISIGHRVTAVVQEAFMLGAFEYVHLDVGSRFPIQRDGFNCGIFIIIYALRIIFNIVDIQWHQTYLDDPSAVRLLMTAWLLTQKEPRIV
jgi:hypothetical protein